jgi:hypothetical protein
VYPTDPLFWHSNDGNPDMRHVLNKPELLDALKECLRDLENTKLLSPEDLDIVNHKRILREQIAALEKEESELL